MIPSGFDLRTHIITLQHTTKVATEHSVATSAVCYPLILKILDLKNKIKINKIRLNNLILISNKKSYGTCIGKINKMKRINTLMNQSINQRLLRQVSLIFYSKLDKHINR